MSPTSAMLATTFGHGHRRPLLTARLKLISLWLGALFFGVLLASSLSDLASVNSYSQAAWFATATFAIQLAAALALVIASGSVTHNRSALLWTALPLREAQLKRLLLFPSLALILSSLALIAPTLATICVGGGQHPLLFIASILTGCCSTLGMTFVHTHRLLCMALMAFVLSCEYRLLEPLRDGNNPWAIAIMIVLALSLSLLVLRTGSTLIGLTKHAGITKPVGRNNLPIWSWFFKKFWRYAPLRRSFLVTAILAGGLSAAVIKYGAFSSSLVIVLAQLLAASLTSDVRSLAKTFRPPEIYALRGSSYFSWHLTGVSLFVSYLALVSVEITTVWHRLPIAPLLACTLSGIGIGLFVGSWLTPRPGDISAQLTANLVCVGIAVVMSRLATLNQHSTLFLYCGLAALGMALSFFIEYKRNALTWRKHGT